MIHIPCFQKPIYSANLTVDGIGNCYKHFKCTQKNTILQRYGGARMKRTLFYEYVSFKYYITKLKYKNKRNK